MKAPAWKAPARILSALCAALAWCAAAEPQEPAQLPVVAQDLKQLQMPGKVEAVLWTRRSDRCTLQLVYPNQGRGGYFIGNTITNLRGLDPTFGARTLALTDGRSVLNDETQPAATRAPVEVRNTAAPAEPKKWTAPAIQAWLLRPDGTIIMPLASATPTSGPGDTVPRESLFSFPLSATREASAVAVNIDGEYRVQKLEPFAD